MQKLSAVKYHFNPTCLTNMEYRGPTSLKPEDKQIIHAARCVANLPGICPNLGDFNAALNSPQGPGGVIGGD